MSSQIEEKTNLEHFNFYLREFVSQLTIVYPKGKDSIESAYSDLLTNQNYKDDKFIKLFMKKAYPASNMIREKNGELFSKQPTEWKDGCSPGHLPGAGQ